MHTQIKTFICIKIIYVFHIIYLGNTGVKEIVLLIFFLGAIVYCSYELFFIG